MVPWVVDGSAVGLLPVPGTPPTAAGARWSGAGASWSYVGAGRSGWSGQERLGTESERAEAGRSEVSLERVWSRAEWGRSGQDRVRSGQERTEANRSGQERD